VDLYPQGSGSWGGIKGNPTLLVVYVRNGGSPKKLSGFSGPEMCRSLTLPILTLHTCTLVARIL
jgi:hypothetical protein